MENAPHVYLTAEQPALLEWSGAVAAALRRRGIGVITGRAGVNGAEPDAALGTAAAWFWTGGGDFDLKDRPELALIAERGLPVFHFKGVATLQNIPPDGQVHLLEEEDLSLTTLLYKEGDADSFNEKLEVAIEAVALHCWGALMTRDLPVAAAHFTGRGSDVAWLEQELRKAKSRARVSLIGAGGTGKTAIAREAVARLTPDEAPFSIFPGGVYVHDFYAAPSVQAFAESVLLASGNTGLTGDEWLDTVRNLLNNERCLVCAEGVEKLRASPNGDNLDALLGICGRAVVLLTSRHTMDSWETVSRFIGGLPVSEAAALLHVHATGHHSPPPADGPFPALAELLGGHPLALTLAGNLMRHSEAAPESVLDAMREAGFEALSMEVRPVESLRFLFHRHALSLTKNARDAWFALSLHGSSLMDRDTIANCTGTSEAEAREALDELVARGIASAAPIPATVSGLAEPGWRLVHSRFAEWGRSRLVDSGVPDATIIARWKMHWFSSFDRWREAKFVPGDEARFTLISEYVRGFVAGLERLETPDSPELLRGLKEGADVLFLMSTSGAINLSERALALSKELHGPRDRTTLECKRRLALSLQYTAPGRSIAMLEEIQAEAEQVCGAGDILTLAAKRNLGQVLGASDERRNRMRAGRLLREAYDQSEAFLGPASKETRECCEALGALHFLEKEWAAAAPLYQKLADVADRRPDLHILGTYAYILSEQKDFAGAAAQWRRVADIAAKSPNPLYEDLLRARWNLAAVLSQQGLHEEAVLLAAENAEICAKHLMSEDSNRLLHEDFLKELKAAASGAEKS